MSTTTEQEIFGVLSDNLRQAAEECRDLAWHPRRGMVYNRFRNSLKLCEGACRQLYYWRDYDSRWLVMKLQLGALRGRCGDWIRGSPSVQTRKVAHPMFKRLSEILSGMAADSERLRTAATGIIGPIMQPVLPGPHRDTRPVQIMTPPGWREAGSGLVLPI